MSASRRCSGRRARLAVILATSVCSLAAGVAVAVAAHRTISRAAAPAVAAAVNLRHADLPRFASQPNPTTAQDRRDSARLNACIGDTPHSEALADASSRSFVRSKPVSLYVDSETLLLPTSSLVAADLAATLRPHALVCLQNAVAPVLRATAPKGSTVAVTVARLPLALAGSDGVSAVRVTAVFRVKRGSTTVTVPAYVDSIGLIYGQAEMTLNLTSTLLPPPPALEARLGALLSARAAAQIG